MFLHVLKSAGQDITNVFERVLQVGIIQQTMGTGTEVCRNVPSMRSTRTVKIGSLHHHDDHVISLTLQSHNTQVLSQTANLGLAI